MNLLRYSVLFLVCFLADIPSGFGKEKAYSEKQGLKLHQRVWELVAKHYYDPDVGGRDWNSIAKKGRRLIPEAENWKEAYQIIDSMLDEFDDAHTFVWSPKKLAEERKEAFVGVGFQTVLHADQPDLNIVNHVITGSPAAEAGIEQGWLFLNSNEIRAQARVAGETKLYRFLDRYERLQEIPLAATPMANWKSGWIRKDLEGGIIYFRMDDFDPGVANWLKGEMELLSGVDSAIIDVRWNPGGLLGELTKVLEQLVPYGTEVGLIKSRNGKSQRWIIKNKSIGKPKLTDYVILVSNYSASSSEILASVIQNENLGVIAGVAPTAGEVLFSPSRDLPGGGLLKIAARDFVDSNRKRLQGNGVVPDIRTKNRSFFELRRGIDPTLNAAISHLHKNK